MSMAIIRACIVFVPLSPLMLGAHHIGPDDVIRDANTAFARGDYETADRLYAQVEEQTDDPGLVAFNRAGVLFQRGEFAEAERFYTRALDDGDCPEGRRIATWFNRGVCWLRLGGSGHVYRSAIICFERCLDLNPTDPKFRAEVEYNLELAKALWMKANAQAPRPERPGELPPEPTPEPALTPRTPGKDEPNDITSPTQKQDGSSMPSPQSPQAIKPQQTPTPMTTEVKTAGNNTQLTVVRGGLDLDLYSPDGARELLRQTDQRLQKRREQMNAVLGGSVRFGVRDW